MRFKSIPQLISYRNRYRVDISWDSLEHHLDRWNVDTDPDFQRAHVWTEEQQRRYVEFCLRGGQSSREILWNSPDFQQGGRSPLVLVDGKQRLEAVRKFLRNELAVFGEFKIKDFEDKLSPFEPCFVFYVNNLKTRVDVLQWYLELNAGGTVHTEDEIEKVRKMLLDEVGIA